MRKGLGLVLALFLGGAVVYGVHNTNTPADVAAYHQQTTQPAQTSTAPAQPTASQPPTKQTTTLSNGNYYTNSDGNRVHAPPGLLTAYRQEQQQFAAMAHTVSVSTDRERAPIMVVSTTGFDWQTRKVAARNVRLSDVGRLWISPEKR
jgi:hypothetical protein